MKEAFEVFVNKDIGKTSTAEVRQPPSRSSTENLPSTLWLATSRLPL